jgi:4-hydroxy 2-oxovalerate aldolase
MQNRRNVIVDTSLYGCGRSAGNAHTELIAQYMNQRQGTAYEIDEVLDLIDTAIVAAQEQTSWGYCIPYFISGVHNAHTFNAKQLLKRHNLKSKDLRAIIERLNDVQKKVYDYALLEELYVEYFDRSIDDAVVIQYLTTAWAQKKILILAPGRSVQMQKAEIDEFVAIESPIVIGCNDLIDGYVLNYIFYSSALRYQNLQYQDYKAAGSPRIILSSNVKTSTETDEFVVNYGSLIKFGWVNLDSSIILLLRLLQRCGINELYVAGLDGYGQTREAFYKKELDTGLDEKTRQEITSDNLSMLEDMKASNPAFSLHFLTESVYREVFE